MINLETLQQAYAAPGQRGSIFTLPLRSYHTWFRGQIAAAESPCQKVALQVAHFVLGIFATLLLGIPALVGMAFNLCATPLPPAAGVEAYSVWAQVWGVPTEAEALIQRLGNDYRLILSMKTVRERIHTNNRYSYSKNQKLSYILTKPEQAGQVAHGIRLICQAHSIALDSYAYEEIEHQEQKAVKLHFPIPDSVSLPQSSLEILLS